MRSLAPLLFLCVVLSLASLGCPRRGDSVDADARRAETIERGTDTATHPDGGEAAPSDASRPIPNEAPSAARLDAGTRPPQQNAADAAADAGSLQPGDACNARRDLCPRGYVCAGCSADDAACIPGCKSDADCTSPETCQRVQCIRCPCPPLCGS